jgi:hypothetical protein
MSTHSGRMELAALAGFLFPFLSHPGPNLLDAAAHIQGGFSTAVAVPLAIHLWTHPQRHTEKCALLIA